MRCRQRWSRTVRKPRGRMAEPVLTYGFAEEDLAMNDIPTIAEAARLIAAKKLSPVELTQACLDRVQALDGELHAFILLTEERALADARAAETRDHGGQGERPAATASRSASRTSLTPRAFARPAIRGSCATTCRTPTRPVR